MYSSCRDRLDPVFPYKTASPSSWRAWSFEDHSTLWPPLAGKAMKLQFLFTPNSVFVLYFGCEAERSVFNNSGPALSTTKQVHPRGGGAAHGGDRFWWLSAQRREWNGQKTSPRHFTVRKKRQKEWTWLSQINFSLRLLNAGKQRNSMLPGTISYYWGRRGRRKGRDPQHRLTQGIPISGNQMQNQESSLHGCLGHWRRRATFSDSQGSGTTM